MILFGHIGITLGIAYLIKTKLKVKIDYRLIFIGSKLPDIIHKPVDMILLPLNYGRIFGHTLKDNALIRGGNLTIEAYGEEDNFSDAISGTGGIISGAAAKGITENNTLTKVYLGGNIRAELINLNSEHKFIFNAKSDSSNASVLGVSGAWCEHSVNSEVYANIKENSQIESNQLIINAISRIEKPSLSETEYHPSQRGRSGCL